MDMRTDAVSSSLPSKAQRRLGIALSALPVLFLAFDGIAKVMMLQAVKDSAPSLGMPLSTLLPIGALLLVCTALYALPKTSLLGAVLLTGYFGGAMAMHVRVENPLFSHVLFPVYLAVFVWGGLLLREPRLRSLLPLR
jgi:hypothetical protein